MRVSKRTAFLDAHREVRLASENRSAVFAPPQVPFPQPGEHAVPLLHGLFGESGTFTAFATSPDGEKNSTIDFVMLADNEAGWSGASLPPLCCLVWAHLLAQLDKRRSCPTSLLANVDCPITD